MTSERPEAGESPSPESAAGASEPVSGGYEPPPIENAQQPSADTPPAYATPEYEPPPPYDPTAYPPPPPYGSVPEHGVPGYGHAGYGTPGFGTPGYTPPGYGAPAFGAPGYPGPGYPGPGYPGTGYPPYGAYGAPAPRTNPLAIASLVAAVVSLCGIGSIAGIVLGVVALNQIKTSGESGRGLAIAGIIVGAVTLLFSLLWLVIMAA